MLGKLMKYEIKATGRTLIPLYIALLAFAIINKFFIGTGLADELEGFGKIPFILSIIAYAFTMAAVFIVTFFVIIQRFYKNLLGDEGYLMNTLPISTATNITSKLTIATFWNIVSGFVAILSIIILAFNPDAFRDFFYDFFQGFAEVYDKFGIQIYIVIIELIIAVLVQLISSVSMIYASMSIGHIFSKHRILLSFAAFIILNLITIAISSALRIGFSFVDWKSMFSHSQSFFPIHMILLFVILFNLVFLIAYFIITNYILKNKLNLE